MLIPKTTRQNGLEYSVFVTFQMEGIHCWPEAKDVFPEVAFLSDPHRHMFHFKCYAKVTHTDRDKEFIMMKREIQQYLSEKYGSPTMQFGRMSCEDIGADLMETFKYLYRVEVSEDGENGAIVEEPKMSDRNIIRG